MNIDSGGWCYAKGEYELQIGTLCMAPIVDSLEPLTVTQQANLQYRLFMHARFRCLSHFTRLERRIVNMVHLPLWLSDISYTGQNQHLIFKVDLKCRNVLAPVELLPELRKEQSYGAHTAQDSSPDLELKLQIEKRIRYIKPDRVIYERVIQQRHTDS
jgi:hypothetical protein